MWEGVKERERQSVEGMMTKHNFCQQTFSKLLYIYRMHQIKERVQEGHRIEI